MCNAVKVCDDQALFTLRIFTERNRTRHIGKHAGVFGRTCFEQLGDAWQTAGNIAGLLRFLWNTREHLTYLSLLSITYRDQRTDWEGDINGVIGSGDLDFFAFLADQLDLRTHRNFATARLRRDHNECRQARHIVNLLRNGTAFFDVLKTHRTSVLGHDRTCERIPGGQARARFQDVTVIDLQCCAVRYFVTFAFAIVFAHDDDFTRARNCNALFLRVRHITHRARKANRTV